MVPVATFRCEFAARPSGGVGTWRRPPTCDKLAPIVVNSENGNDRRCRLRHGDSQRCRSDRLRPDGREPLGLHDRARTPAGRSSTTGAVAAPAPPFRQRRAGASPRGRQGRASLPLAAQGASDEAGAWPAVFDSSRSAGSSTADRAATRAHRAFHRSAPGRQTSPSGMGSRDPRKRAGPAGRLASAPVSHGPTASSARHWRQPGAH